MPRTGCQPSLDQFPVHTAHSVNAVLLLLIAAIPVILAGHVALTLPAVGLGSLAFLYGNTLLDKKAWWYNLPKKETILGLPASDQDELFRHVDALFYWLTTGLLGLLCYVQLILHLPFGENAITAAILVGGVVFAGAEMLLLAYWMVSFDDRVSDKLEKRRDE